MYVKFTMPTITRPRTYQFEVLTCKTITAVREIVFPKQVSLTNVTICCQHLWSSGQACTFTQTKLIIQSAHQISPTTLDGLRDINRQFRPHQNRQNCSIPLRLELQWWYRGQSHHPLRMAWCLHPDPYPLQPTWMCCKYCRWCRESDRWNSRF